MRRSSAQFISALVEKMGPMKCLLGPRDIGENLLPAAARFIQDHSSHTRYFGRRIFAALMQHPLFDKFLRRHVSPGTYRNICGMLETIKRRVCIGFESLKYSLFSHFSSIVYRESVMHHRICIHQPYNQKKVIHDD